MNALRREKLRAFIECNDAVTLAQITELLPDVSGMTIHRDLLFLQQQGYVQRIRGGARYIRSATLEPAFTAREIVNIAQKQAVAQKAVALLGDTASLFVDAGTTMMAFARLLPDEALHIVTTGPNIALSLSAKQNPLIELCGGTLNKANLTLSGGAALETIRHYNIDTAFLVASGYTDESGFTCGCEPEAQIKALVIQKARRSIMLIDTTKFGRLLPYTFAQLPELDALVTELPPPELPAGLREAARSAGVTLV